MTADVAAHRICGEVLYDDDVAAYCVERWGTEHDHEDAERRLLDDGEYAASILVLSGEVAQINVLSTTERFDLDRSKAADALLVKMATRDFRGPEPADRVEARMFLNHYGWPLEDAPERGVPLGEAIYVAGGERFWMGSAEVPDEETGEVQRLAHRLDLYADRFDARVSHLAEIIDKVLDRTHPLRGAVEDAAWRPEVNARLDALEALAHPAVEGLCLAEDVEAMFDRVNTDLAEVHARLDSIEHAALNRPDKQTLPDNPLERRLPASTPTNGPSAPKPFRRPSRHLAPGTRLRHADGSYRTLRDRKGDDTGWWLVEGGGINDNILDDPNDGWTVWTIEQEP